MDREVFKRNDNLILIIFWSEKQIQKNEKFSPMQNDDEKELKQQVIIVHTILIYVNRLFHGNSLSFSNILKIDIFRLIFQISIWKAIKVILRKLLFVSVVFFLKKKFWKNLQMDAKQSLFLWRMKIKILNSIDLVELWNR